MAAEVKMTPIEGVGLLVTLNKRALQEIIQGSKVKLDMVTETGRVQMVFVRDSVWQEEQRKQAKRKPVDAPKEAEQGLPS